MLPTDSSNATADNRWAAIVQRDAAADGRFVYAVRTTGVYCRPHCASRRPNRRNVEFFDSPIQAEAAGYRACRRCRPKSDATTDPSAEKLIRACRFIEQAEVSPTLAEIADHVAASPDALHRLFRTRLGVTPKEYAVAHRANRLKSQLQGGTPVTQAIYAAGYESSGRCYTESDKVLGMTPKRYRDGGPGTCIRFAVARCALGRVLVAATDKGVCRIAFGDDDDDLRAGLLAAFPAAEQVTRDPAFAELLAAVLTFIEAPGKTCPFPLDIRGTAFQQKVWRALQAIPPGETRSYSEVGEAIGRSGAARAVASACAANSLAVAVPCHRVVRRNGDLSGYRWGPARKQAMLNREANGTVKRKRQSCSRV